MNGVIVSLARMLLFRGGPQNLPASWSLTFLMVAAYLAQNLITGQQLGDDGTMAKSLLILSLQVFLLAGLLSWRRHMERFAQTLSALAAMGVIFNTITSALLTQSNPEMSQPWLALTWFSVFIWSL